jgi:hypothetical protein
VDRRYSLSGADMDVHTRWQQGGVIMPNSGDGQRATIAVGCVPQGYGSGSPGEWYHAEVMGELRRIRERVDQVAQTLAAIQERDNP